jgi:hypothetical protein
MVEVKTGDEPLFKRMPEIGSQLATFTGESLALLPRTLEVLDNMR